MSDDRPSVTRRQKNSEDDDRPPPIPPRPSFTFAARRDASATSRHGSSTPQQADAPSQATPSEVKAQHGADSKKLPVPPPRNKSKKSTDDLSVVIAPADVTCGDVRSPDAANDEVFLAVEDAKTEADTEHAEDDDAKMCRRDDAVDPQSVGSETVFDEASVVSSDQSPHRLPRTEEASDSSLTQSAGVLARGIVTPSVTAPCQKLTDSGVGTTSTGVVTGGKDDRLDKDSLAELNNTSVHRAGSEASTSLEQTVNVRRPSQSSEQTQFSPRARVAPVIRFSELDDFGLDPDLFRPDCLEEDVPFSEKTAKFTRSASPLYEPVIDDDETGLTSLSCRY